MSEMVTLRVTAGQRPPMKFFVAPGGRALNNRGVVAGMAQGHDTIVVHAEEAQVLLKPDAEAKGHDGKALLDGAGNPIRNRSLAQFQMGGDVADAMKFEKVKTSQPVGEQPAGKSAGAVKSDKKDSEVKNG